MTAILVALALTALAGAWRYFDGRGRPWGEARIRNAVGVAVALACGWWGPGEGLPPAWHDPLWYAAPAAGGLAALTLIAGFTDWESWKASLPRYGGPTAAIAVLAHVGGAPAMSCAPYAAGGFLVAAVYVLLNRTGRSYADYVCTAVAGAVIVGGLAWIGA